MTTTPAPIPVHHARERLTLLASPDATIAEVAHGKRACRVRLEPRR